MIVSQNIGIDKKIEVHERISQNYIKGIYITNKDRKNICGTLVPTSGTPPTRVLTVNNPQLAASNMAMQKASVKEL
jgi:hypothetical protein